MGIFYWGRGHFLGLTDKLQSYNLEKFHGLQSMCIIEKNNKINIIAMIQCKLIFFLSWMEYLFCSDCKVVDNGA